MTTVCPGGVGLLADHPLPLGEPVQVTVPGFILLAEVRHCGPEGDGHRIGLELIQRLTHADVKSLAGDVPRRYGGDPG